jgi:starvation-inducible DNA-binding protein
MPHHQHQSGGGEPQSNLYATAVNIPEENRVRVIQALNQALADTTDLQSQAKFAHWNVKGYDFYQLHLLFDEVAETLSEHVDLLAERITALGGQAMGTTRIAAGTSRIPEPPRNAVSETDYVEWLTNHVGQHANSLRVDIERAAELGDEDTADLFTELSREVDTHLYFLESHLQSEVQTRIPVTARQVSGSGMQAGAGREPTGQASASGMEASVGETTAEQQQSPAGRQPVAGEQSAIGQQPTADQRPAAAEQPAAGQQQFGGQQSATAHGGAPVHESAMRGLQGSSGGTSQQSADWGVTDQQSGVQSRYPPRQNRRGGDRRRF